MNHNHRRLAYRFRLLRLLLNRKFVWMSARCSSLAIPTGYFIQHAVEIVRTIHG